MQLSHASSMLEQPSRMAVHAAGQHTSPPGLPMLYRPQVREKQDMLMPEHNASSCTCLDVSYAFPHSMPGSVHQLPGKGMPKQLRSVSCTAAARIPNSAARALESAVLRRPLPGRGEEFQRRCQDCCSKPSLLFEHVVKYMICDLLHVMNLLAHGTCFPT